MDLPKLHNHWLSNTGSWLCKKFCVVVSISRVAQLHGSQPWYTAWLRSILLLAGKGIRITRSLNSWKEAKELSPSSTPLYYTCKAKPGDFKKNNWNKLGKLKSENWI